MRYCNDAQKVVFRRSLYSSLLILSMLSAAPTVLANDDENQNFSAAYHAYEQALQSKDQQQILTTAAMAYQLGQAKYAKDSIEMAALGMNWAKALEDDLLHLEQQPRAQQQLQANKLYQQALDVYQQHFGKDTINTLDPLLGVAESSSDKADTARLFRQAIALVEDVKADPLMVADVKMAAFQSLRNTQEYSRTVMGYALKAYDIYKEKLPENDVRRVNAAFAVAQINLAEKRYDASETLLLEVIKQYSALSFSHPYELASHAMLVDIYQKEGKPDLATEHCQAIGRMQPWKDTQEQTPIFRIPPDYPQSAVRAHKSGWVQLVFDVDKAGFVTNPKVIQSRGGSDFERASVEVLKKWRYAPKFENGEPVIAQTSVQLDYKIN